MSIQGYVDRIDVDTVGGWVFDDTNINLDVVVDLYDANEYLGSVPANMDGDDLKQAGIAKPDSRFLFRLPRRVAMADLPHITAVPRGHDASLPGNIADQIGYLTDQLYGEELRHPYYNAISSTCSAFVNGRAYFSMVGDVYADEQLFDSLAIVVQDAQSSRCAFNLPTLGCASGFWFFPDKENLGFKLEGVINTPADQLVRVHLRYREKKSQLVTEIPIAAIPVGALADESRALLPQDDMITRVIGPTADPWHGYVVGGWSNAVHLDWMNRKYAGKSLRECGAILDWGSGCARNTRPIMQIAGPDVDVIGIDVDPVNVQWSKDHIAGDRFLHTGYYPPLSLGADRFDVVYGLSVFTHLTELVQDMWLEEIHKLLKPGGMAFLTFHGEMSALPRIFSLDEIQNYVLRGIEDYVPDDALRMVGDDMNYYRSTFHTTRYIKERWGRFFDVMGLETALGGHQWFAACRKK